MSKLETTDTEGQAPRTWLHRFVRLLGYACPVCEDVKHRLKGHRCSKLDGEHGLAAATMRAWEQEWGDGASGDAGAMLRRELRSVIRRYGQESDVTAYQAIGALRMVEHDIVDMQETIQQPEGGAAVRSSDLLGVKRFRKPNKPKDGECVLWIWAAAGQITAGDYYKGQPRDAAKNYEPITDCKPTHWMPWPENWPDA